MNIESIKLRGKTMRMIRSYFDECAYLEVETPLLTPHLIPESTIEPFETSLRTFDGTTIGAYLIPSPEVWMKILIAKGIGNMYQICRCFRNTETEGAGHNPEFTMLEWYTIGADYQDSLSFTERMFAAVLPDNTPDDLRPPFTRMSIHESFVEYAGFSLEDSLDLDSLSAHGREAGVNIREEDTWEQVFNKVFLQLVEPELPKDKPVALMDYPKALPTLAADRSNTPWSERWELYVRGVELANCYTEETGIDKVKTYYKTESAAEDVARRTDHTYPEIFDNTYPACSGVALGIDRLIALISGVIDIRGVILFPISGNVWVP